MADYSVIMADGKGTKLWPLSRASAPKQFIQFVSDRTLFQATLARVSDASLYEPPIVITNEDFRFLAAEQARELGVALTTILPEPVARNTAAAVAAAAAFVARRFGDDAILQLLASDHEIRRGAGLFRSDRWLPRRLSPASSSPSASPRPNPPPVTVISRSATSCRMARMP